jgi:GTPase SAR1 family protein
LIFKARRQFYQFVVFQIWDTAGQERFRSMTSAFYSKAQGVVVAFDVSQRSSFDSLTSWINDVRMVKFKKNLFFFLSFV